MAPGLPSEQMYHVLCGHNGPLSTFSPLIIIVIRKFVAGLDPAGPLFESQDPRARLDSSDADFVDVIHSNGENLILGGLGSSQPMGHVDFYPNGGRMQKGCSHLIVGAVTGIFLCEVYILCASYTRININNLLS